jgi:hypothetical protein
MLCAKTSNPDRAKSLTASKCPLKSGVRHSTSIEGFLSFNKRTVRAKCLAPPSGRSSLSTEVRTTYPTPQDVTACAPNTFVRRTSQPARQTLPSDAHPCAALLHQATTVMTPTKTVPSSSNAGRKRHMCTMQKSTQAGLFTKRYSDWTCHQLHDNALANISKETALHPCPVAGQIEITSTLSNHI